VSDPPADPREPDRHDERRTAIERMLGRHVAAPEPPNLHDWIKRFGGYVNISPEGCPDYKAALEAWDEARFAPPVNREYADFDRRVKEWSEKRRKPPEQSP
jgi:hypothetical protein